MIQQIAITLLIAITYTTFGFLLAVVLEWDARR